MAFQPLIEYVLPGPSSQTTSSWPISLREGVQLVVDNMSFNVSSVVIKAPRGRSWADVMEQVLRDRAQTWEELAAL